MSSFRGAFAIRMFNPYVAGAFAREVFTFAEVG